MRQTLVLVAVSATVALAGCQQPGADLEPNVYKTGQVNQKQDAEVVNILAILPAKIEVPNHQARAGAQLIGGLAGVFGGAALGNNIARHSEINTVVGGAAGGGVGVAAGSMVSDKTLVEGVSLTYVADGKTLNSAQVGRTCDFRPGNAIVISTGPNQTRIQPNDTCPTAQSSRS